MGTVDYNRPIDHGDRIGQSIDELYAYREEFRVSCETTPEIILRELDDPRDSEFRDRIMALAGVSTDTAIRNWYTEIEERAAMRYARRMYAEARRSDPLPEDV